VHCLGTSANVNITVSHTKINNTCILSAVFTDLKITRHIQLYFYPTNIACSYQHTSGINHNVGPAFVTRRLYSVWSAVVLRVFPYC